MRTRPLPTLLVATGLLALACGGSSGQVSSRGTVGNTTQGGGGWHEGDDDDGYQGLNPGGSDRFTVSYDEQTLYEVYEDSIVALDVNTGRYTEVLNQYGVDRWGVFLGATRDLIVAEEGSTQTLYLVDSGLVVAEDAWQVRDLALEEARVAPLGDVLVIPEEGALRLLSLEDLTVRDVSLPAGVVQSSGWLAGIDTLLVATVPEDEPGVSQPLTLHAVELADGATLSRELGPTGVGPLSAGATILTTSTRAVATVPAVSFYDGLSELRVVDLLTGAVTPVPGTTAAWLPDGRSFVADRSDGVYRVRLDGAAQAVERSVDWPVWVLLPDGPTLVTDYDADVDDLHMTDLVTGEQKTATWASTIWQVAIRGTTLYILDGSGKLFELETVTGRIDETVYTSNRIAYLPLSDVLLIDGAPGTVRVLDPETMTVLRDLKVDL